MKAGDQEYLGDGVYVKCGTDCYYLELRANDKDSNDVIYLEREVYERLVKFANKVWKPKE